MKPAASDLLPFEIRNSVKAAVSGGRMHKGLCQYWMGEMVEDTSEFVDERSVLSALGMEVDGTEGGIAYTVIPGRYGPRWIVPNQPARTRNAFREWRPYSKIGIAAWMGTR